MDGVVVAHPRRVLVLKTNNLVQLMIARSRASKLEVTNGPGGKKSKCAEEQIAEHSR